MNTPSYKLKIKVTKDILERTKNCQDGLTIGKHCAIAVAVRDIFPKAFVEHKAIYFKGAYSNLFTSLPSIATRFIRRFDSYSPKRRANMHPIEFEISVPDEVIEKINLDELAPLLVNHPNLKLQSV